MATMIYTHPKKIAYAIMKIINFKERKCIK